MLPTPTPGVPTGVGSDVAPTAPGVGVVDPRKPDQKESYVRGELLNGFWLLLLVGFGLAFVGLGEETVVALVAMEEASEVGTGVGWLVLLPEVLAMFEVALGVVYIPDEILANILLASPSNGLPLDVDPPPLISTVS